jgi:hypothetical protein
MLSCTTPFLDLTGILEMSLKSALLLFVATGALLPSALSAQYIDPGTSSLIWQLLISGLVGGWFLFRSKIGTVFNPFRRGRRGQPDFIEKSESQDKRPAEDLIQK